MVRTIVVLVLLFASPVLVLAQTPPPPPAVVAYESALLTRLTWLGQQEYAIRNDDETRRCKRWKIMGLVFGGLGVAGAIVGLEYLALRSTSDRDLTYAERATIGAVIGGLGAGGLTGLGFAIASRVTNPHRAAYRQVRIEQKQIRRELRRVHDARYSLSANGFTLSF
jgi:MFS family permease